MKSSNLSLKSRDPSSKSRNDLILVSVLAFAAFGPYLVGSIRTEQLTVYIAVIIAGLALLGSLRFLKDGLPFLFAWMALLLVSSISIVAPVSEFFAWKPGSFVSGLDNFLLPFAIMLIIWGTVREENAAVALKSVAKITVWGAAGNALLAMVQSQINLDSILRHFWASSNADGTTAERAAQGLRYSGIFNQPAEVGAFYSLAMVLAIWLYWNRPILLYSALILITLGGIFAITKSFLYVGFPIGIIYLLAKYKWPGRILTLAFLFLLFFIMRQWSFLHAWGGYDRIGNLAQQLFYVEGDSQLANLTAGRWNEGAQLVNLMSTVLDTRPLSGYGFAGLGAAYDSLWTEVIVQSGILGLICIISIFISFIFMGLRIPDRELRTLSFAVGAVIIGASFGIPMLTSNRVATVTWLIITLLVLQGSFLKKQERQRHF